MNEALVECVPNVSEGKDGELLDALSRAAGSVPGAAVLHRDVNADAGRSVFTLAGTTEALFEAVWRFAEETIARIDLRQHRGAHNRLGALDVCPFVPLRGSDMASCVVLAERLGQRIGEELGVPVFLYEEAAREPYRRSLPKVRGKGYEQLQARIVDPRWTPDFGPAEFNPKSGACIVGARNFLIAYNINLSTEDPLIAQAIAERLRESGVKGRPGLLPAVRAIGWSMPDYRCTQVSMNLLDYRQSGLYEVYSACREEAKRFGTDVAGSELIGLLPEEALLNCGRRVLNNREDASRRDLLNAAVSFLGLDSLTPFSLEERILECRLAAELPYLGLLKNEPKG